MIAAGVFLFIGALVSLSSALGTVDTPISVASTSIIKEAAPIRHSATPHETAMLPNVAVNGEEMSWRGISCMTGTNINTD